MIQPVILLTLFLIAIWKGDWYLRLLAAGVLFFMFGYLAVGSPLRHTVTVLPLVIAVSVVGMELFFRTDFLNRKPRLFPAKNKRSKEIIGEMRMILP